jgi:hypothetical protein
MMDFDEQGYEEQDYLDPLEPFEDEEPQRSFGGLSPVEIGILVVLLLVICGLAGFIGKSVYDNAVAEIETPTPSPTVFVTPTIPADATSTPWATAASITDWNQFAFAGEKASLWLPNSFQGGDPIAYPEIFRMTIETYSDDEVFLQSVDDLLSDNPEITFFVFDPEVIEWPRVAAVSSEKLPSKWVSNESAYLEDLAADMGEDGNRFIGKEYVVLDNFEAWRFIAELQVPVGEDGYYTYSKMVSYLIPVDDLLWTVTYSTGRDDFPEYWPIIKDSINTFYVQP